MLSNEQRAHDLAIATMRYLLDKPLSDIQVDGYLKNNGENISIDIFKMYLDLYNKILDSMNREFSE